MFYLLSIFLPIVCFAAYPFDYSERECRDMFPERLGHDAEHKHGDTAPYHIEPTDTMYLNQPIKVFIESLDEHPIQGLFIQARVGDCDARGQKQPIGHFDVDHSVDFLIAVNCSNKVHNAASNKHWGKKKKLVTVFWTPPRHETRKLYFVATIVADRSRFWTDIYSETIRSANDRSGNNAERCPNRHKYKPGSLRSSCEFIIPSSLILLLLCTLTKVLS